MKNFKQKIHFFVATFGIGCCISGNLSAIENTKQMGQLHGKILTISGADVTSVIIQVVGVTERDPFISYTTPNENGEFNFDGQLPAGSVVQLYFWDSKGVLNRTILNAYVSKMNSNTVGIYEVTMQDTQYAQDLSQIFNVPHELTNTGLCGFVGGDGNGNPSGVRVVAYDRLARYAGPIGTQTIDANGKFCFFNLTSPSRTDLYDFMLFDERGEQTTFTFFLPPSIFMHDIYFDPKSSLYRAPLSNDASRAVNFSTSEDYSPVSADGSLAYFPLSNELLEITYSVGNANQNRFFILFPRTQLFQNSKARVAAQSGSQMVYLDDTHSLPLKFVTEDELINLNSNLYFQTWSESFGSVFVDLDLSQFGIQNSNAVKLSLRNSAGQEVGVFEKLIGQKFSGYFLNIFPGLYHVFLTTLDNQLLWTYEVRSYPNRVQMLVNDVNPKLFQRKSQETSSGDSQMPSNDLQMLSRDVLMSSLEFGLSSRELGLSTGDVIAEPNEMTAELNALRHEAKLASNNIIYQQDADAFCKKTNPPKLLEMLQNMQ